MALSPGQRNVAAEVRAVASGKRCYVDEDTGACRILSDTHGDIGKAYTVTFAATRNGPVVFHCEPTGPHAYQDDHMACTYDPGMAPCVHAALSARRLAREGLIRFDYPTGLWTDAGKAPVVEDARDPFDLFAGR